MIKYYPYTAPVMLIYVFYVSPYRPSPLLCHMQQGAHCIVVDIVMVKYVSIGGVRSLCVL